MTGRAIGIGVREIESAATRRAILKAAEHLLATRGDEGLSIRDVCARAGVTPPTIYHHFGDRQNLLERIVEKCFQAFGQMVEKKAASAAISDPVKLLRWGCEQYIDWGIRHPTYYQVMFQRRRVKHSGVGLQAYERLKAAMQDIAAAGRLRAPVEEATAAVWCAIHGVTNLVVIGTLQRDPRVVTLVLDGVLDRLTTAVPAKERRPRRTNRHP